MQKSKLQLKIQNCLIIIILFFMAMPVFAARISLDSKTKEIGVNSQFEVPIFINTENQSINAIEGELIFSRDLFGLREIKYGNSIINFWVEKPKKADKIVFSGIIPGGYTGDKGLLFSAIFYTKKEGKGFIEIRNPKTLLNDGQGTETNTKASALGIIISAEEPSFLPTKKKDTEPPEPFEPAVANDPTIFNGKYFLVFATQDKDSDIDYYEVCEKGEKCKVAGSPYLLKNQKLDKKIIVKAIDKNGNERIATLSAQKPVIWYKNYLIFAIIVLAIEIIYLPLKFLWRKRKK